VKAADMNDDNARLTPEEEEDFVASVLRRTSGGACVRAEELLCADISEETFADINEEGVGRSSRFALDVQDRALLEAHLEHCPACASLARSLAVLRDTLPHLASFDPGPSFTSAVLDATSRAERGTLVDRLADWWKAWLSRPRFALEAAYVATVLVVLVFGNPAATLQAASQRTVSAAAAGFDRAREVWPAAIAKVTPGAVELPASVRGLGSATTGVIERGAAGALGAAWERAMRQWSVAWGWLRGVASNLLGSASATWTHVRDVVEGWMSGSSAGAKGPASGSRPGAAEPTAQGAR
jgi:hypothetical protein